MTEHVKQKETEITYNPENDSAYMSPAMLHFFEDKLKKLAGKILEKEKKISVDLVDWLDKEPDPVDQGAREGLHYPDISYQEHENQLRQEAISALQRIKDGTYGYCETTGQEIGVKRLLIVPTARHCVKVQEKLESTQKY